MTNIEPTFGQCIHCRVYWVTQPVDPCPARTVNKGFQAGFKANKMRLEIIKLMADSIFPHKVCYSRRRRRIPSATSGVAGLVGQDN